MKGSRVVRPVGAPRFEVSADGEGVASRAGTPMLRELAVASGLVDHVTGALADTYDGPWLHAPGQVFCDMAVAVADGSGTIEGIEQLREREQLHGELVASDSTAWRLLRRIDQGHLPAVRSARAAARERAWAAGAAPDTEGPLVIDVDATIVTAESDKENAAATWKKTFGFHPLVASLDRPEIAGGELLEVMARPGNAGSNTAVDHVDLLRVALEQLPVGYRPGVEGAPPMLVRSDSAGATHGFAKFCAESGVEFSFGFGVDITLVTVADTITKEEQDTGAQLWQPAIESDGSIRDGAWVVEVTGSTGADLQANGWPEGSRLILRKERPHPGAQLALNNTTDEGMRLTAFICNTPPEPGHHVAALDLRHRQHARVEDRIKDAKTTGLGNLPAFDYAANTAWCQIVATAIDLLTWTRLLAFADTPALARATPATFRTRVLHLAARITRGARRLHLRLDATSRYATDVATGWMKLRTAFT